MKQQDSSGKCFEETQKALAELAQSDHNCHDFNIFTSIGSMTLDVMGLILDTNPAAAALIGQERIRLMKEPFDRFVDQEYQPVFRLFLKRVFSANGRKTCELKLLVKEHFVVLEGLALRDNAPGAAKRCHVMMVDISDRMEMIEALREGESRFRAIADYGPDWENWIGPDGKLIWVNPRVFEFTGYTVAECMRMDDYPIAIVHEDDRERMNRLFIQAVGGSSAHNVECRVVAKDGRQTWVGVSWQPIFDASGGNLGHRTSIRDITERKRLEEQFRLANERLEGMLNALPELMFRIDRDGCIHECHFSSIDRLYVPPSSFMGKKVTEVIPEEAAQIIMAAIDEAAVLGRHHGAVYSLPMPKGLSWYELSIAAMGTKGQPDYEFIMLIHDITARKQLEEKLKKAHEELEMRVQKRTEELALAVKTLSDNEQLLASESEKLKETNTALRVLLQHREEDQQDMENKILANIRKLVLPYVEKLQSTSLAPVQAGYLDEMRNPHPTGVVKGTG